VLFAVSRFSVCTTYQVRSGADDSPQLTPRVFGKDLP